MVTYDAPLITFHNDSMKEISDQVLRYGKVDGINGGESKVIRFSIWNVHKSFSGNDMGIAPDAVNLRLTTWNDRLQTDMNSVNKMVHVRCRTIDDNAPWTPIGGNDMYTQIVGTRGFVNTLKGDNSPQIMEGADYAIIETKIVVPAGTFNGLRPFVFALYYNFI